MSLSVDHRWTRRIACIRCRTSSQPVRCICDAGVHSRLRGPPARATTLRFRGHDTLARWPFQQMGHPPGPLDLWPHAQVFQPRLFMFGTPYQRGSRLFGVPNPLADSEDVAIRVAHVHLKHMRC